MRINRELLYKKLISEFEMMDKKIDLNAKKEIVKDINKIMKEKSINLNEVFAISRVMKTLATKCQPTAHQMSA